MRRYVLLVSAAVLALAGAASTALPAGANPVHDVDPALLALPQSALPAGSVVEESLVSTNADADNSATNPIRQLHQRNYADLGRQTGYRQKFHFALGSGTVTITYVGSLFTTSVAARAALDDATGSGSIISLIGQAVTPPCTIGDVCRAYSGANGSSQIVYAASVHGRVLVEAASASDAAAFAANGTAVEAALFAVVSAGDKAGQAALSAGTLATPVPSPTAAPTATPVVVQPIIPRNPYLAPYYLALGDSFSFGYQVPEIATDYQCNAADAPGFVCVFWRYLKTIKPSVQLQNMSEGGADSCQLAGEGHRCYDATPRSNPVDAAVTFLNAHAGQVSPITVTIGGNDLLALLGRAVNDPGGTVALLPGVIVHYRSNLDVILGRIRAAAGPTPEIILTTQPNALIGIGSPPLPAGLPQAGKGALERLNAVMKEEAPKYGVVVADSYAAWESYAGDPTALDWFSTYFSKGRYEIHPTPLGYQVYGKELIKDSGFLPTLDLAAHLRAKRVRHGATDGVAGTTNPAVTITVRFHNPHHAVQTVTARAGDDGSYTVAFKAGKKKGSGTVQVCAADAAGRSRCSGSMTYTVQ